MSLQDDLEKANGLLKPDTHDQLERSDGTFASWIQPGQSFEYYLWDGTEDSDGELLLEQKYAALKNLEGNVIISRVGSVFPFATIIGNVMQQFSMQTNLQVDPFGSTPATDDGYTFAHGG